MEMVSSNNIKRNVVGNAFDEEVSLVLNMFQYVEDRKTLTEEGC